MIDYLHFVTLLALQSRRLMVMQVMKLESLFREEQLPTSMARNMWISCVNYLMRFQARIVVKCCKVIGINNTSHYKIINDLPLSQTAHTKFFFCVCRSMCSFKFSFCLNAESHPL
jgi:hypothetical protein